ncbi:MAG: TetR family transcriptional regulator [Candidatus Hydrogenedens sp.]|nr:TetR family transcriptional regulator [Candidatus Hydrogenedens sp.]
MVQVLKEEVRTRILKAGRAEFLEKDFQSANMRSIAKRAGCGLSNLYNYFKSKDALFEALVEPTMMDFYQVIAEAHTRLPENGAVVLTFEQERVHFMVALEFLRDHREDVILLVLKSEGSTVHLWHEAAIQAYETVWFNYIDYLRKNFPDEHGYKISEFFVHNISRFYFNTLVEFLKQDLSFEQMEQHVEELLRYAHGGIHALLLNQGKIE